MMNGNAGSYTYAFSSSTNQHQAYGEALLAAAASQQQPKAAQHPRSEAAAPRGGYLPQPPQPPPNNLGPDSNRYDPANPNSNSGGGGSAQQHHLFMASAVAAAANYAAQHQQQQQHHHHHHHHHHHQQQQHQQQQHHDLAAAANVFLSQAAQQATAEFDPNQHHNNTTSIVPGVSSHASNNSNHHHARHSSFDQMLLMHPSLLAPLDAFPLPVASHAVPPAAPSSNGFNNNGNNNHNTNSAANARQKLMAMMMIPSGSSSNGGAADSEVCWLREIHLEVPSISLEPLSGDAVLQRIGTKLEDVLTKYIPCVDFLVQCQQDLRRGLEVATRQPAPGGSYRSRARRTTPREFFAQHIHSLPEQFYAKNRFQMESAALETAYEGLQQLRREAERSSGATASNAGCEAVKSTFLGGMKDGESWGLRKWLSRHGDALAVCTDLECILGACQKLDKGRAATRQLSDRLRPMAQHVLDRLKADIPASYQQHSTAHPYLPFFHRLEAALRSMSQFDPADDGVICIDDSDDDDDVAVVEPVRSVAAAPAPAAKRKRTPPIVLAADDDDDDDNDNGDGNYSDDSLQQHPGKKRAAVWAPAAAVPPLPRKPSVDFDDASSSGESETESVVEIIDLKACKLSSDDWKCGNCEMENSGATSNCLACGEENLMKDFIPGLDYFFNSNSNSSNNQSRSRTPNSAASFDSTVFLQQQEEEAAAAAALTSTKASKKKKKAKQQAREQQQQLVWPLPIDQPDVQMATARIIADNLDQLASIFDNEQQGAVRPMHAPHIAFWDGPRYASALRLFADLLRRHEAPHFLDPVDEDRLIRANAPPFSHVIKHPVCFRDIAAALLGDDLQVSAGNDGTLPVKGLSDWNMWKGTDLLMAIDLVFLNTLAYGKQALNEGKTPRRSLTNKARKVLWDGIHALVNPQACSPETKRKCMPMRRSETSGFVVYKISNSSES